MPIATKDGRPNQWVFDNTGVSVNDNTGASTTITLPDDPCQLKIYADTDIRLGVNDPSDSAGNNYYFIPANTEREFYLSKNQNDLEVVGDSTSGTVYYTIGTEPQA